MDTPLDFTGQIALAIAAHNRFSLNYFSTIWAFLPISGRPFDKPNDQVNNGSPKEDIEPENNKNCDDLGHANRFQSE